MRRKKVTRADVDEAGKNITCIRATLNGEIKLLLEHHDPRLVSYCLLSSAIATAKAAGMAPEQFAKLAAETLDLFCSEKASGITTNGNSIIVVFPDPDEE
jgi:hypothetical protein